MTVEFSGQLVAVLEVITASPLLLLLSAVPVNDCQW